MIEPIEGAPDGVIAFKAVGKVEGSDYDSVLRPAIDKAVEERGNVRLVYQLGSEFDGYSSGGVWEDMKLGTAHLSKWERCAVVTDHRLIGDAVKAFGILMPGEVKVFPVSELQGALAWASE